jgi:hypothetical protein
MLDYVAEGGEFELSIPFVVTRLYSVLKFYRHDLSPPSLMVGFALQDPRRKDDDYDYRNRQYAGCSGIPLTSPRLKGGRFCEIQFPRSEPTTGL